MTFSYTNTIIQYVVISDYGHFTVEWVMPTIFHGRLWGLGRLRLVFGGKVVWCVISVVCGYLID